MNFQRGLLLHCLVLFICIFVKNCLFVKNIFVKNILDKSCKFGYVICISKSNTDNTVDTDKQERRKGSKMFQIDYRSKKPIYEQIIEQMKLYVVKGQLSPGDAIPSVRKLAQALGVTPSTVAKAYQELERQKVIETIRAKGTFIAGEVSVNLAEEQMEAIRQRMKSEILELKRIGYSKEDVMRVTREIYESI